MNCKQGDLAVVVRSDAGNEGCIVRCLCIAPSGKRLMRADGVIVSDAIWEIDRQLKSWVEKRNTAFCPDSWLRPISNPGDDARDETLTWLPVPTREGVPA